MKKITTLGLALCLAATATAQWGKKVKGNGNRVTIERNTGDYGAVSVSGWFDVILADGEEGQITLEGEENLLEHIVTEVNGTTLEIRTEKGVDLRPSSGSESIVITVPVDRIDAVSLSGSGDIVGKKTLQADTFETTMSGSGDITLQVEASSVITSMSGSGDITLSGNASQFEVRISGSGDVKAYELEADEVEATISGSADIRVTANKSLMARVSGSGDIHYRGNPEKIDTKSSGSGDISRG